MRDKLIELIKEARDIGDRHCEEMGSCAKCHELGYDIGKCGEIIIADHLIAHGVKLDVAETNVGGKKPMTNGQRIRAMSDEELVKNILDVVIHCPRGIRPAPTICVNGCFECWKNWLQQEVAHDTD